MKTCDLHLHSHYSDGTWSPTELVNHAIGLKLSLVALTDHDSINGLEEASSAARGKLELINGVEISCRFNKESKPRDFHLLGYFVDPEASVLNKVLNYNQNVRLQFAHALIIELNNRGIPLTFEAIQKFSLNGTIGASHITKALLDCGVTGDIMSVYSQYFGKNKEIEIDRNWIDIAKGIEAINSAGGVAVLAHPGFDSSIQSILSDLKNLGLAGVEIYHSYHSKEDTLELLKLADQLDLVVTGGSDCHGPYEGSAPYMGAMNLSLEKVEAFLGLKFCQSKFNSLSV